MDELAGVGAVMTDRFPRYYILVDRVPFAVDLMTWARWFNDGDRRRVARTVIDEALGVWVSTVFLGLDHNFLGRGDPVLFETMCFGPTDGTLAFGRETHPSIGETWRYSSWKDAEAGHAAMCDEVRAMLDDIKTKVPGGTIRSEQ
jgi:hypothetical protein